MVSIKRKDNSSSIALKAGIWYVVSSVLVRLVSIITTPIFTRLLSTDEYGIVSTFSSWYSMFFVIYSLNLTISIGRAKLDYPDKLDDYIGSSQLLSLIVSLALSTIILVFTKPVSSFFELPEIATILLLIYLIASPTINFFQSGYRYKYKYKQNIAIAWYTTLSTAILSLILIFFVDYDKAILRIIGLSAPSILLSAFFWIKTVKNKNVRINFEYWRYGLAISLPMIIHSLSMNILSQSDRIVISKYWGSTFVAYYSLVQNYAILLNVVTEAINQAWQPWFHDNYFAHNNEQIKNNTNKLVIFFCYVGLACIAIGPEAILILGGTQYSSAVNCIPPLVLGTVCQCIYTNYINIELHLKKTRYAAEGTIIAAILNIVLNLALVPHFGYFVAAYTTFASYLVLLVIHYLITRKRLKVKLYNDKFMFLSMIVTSGIGLLLSLTYDYTFIRWSIILIGFINFLFVFRSFIFGFINKYRK